MPTLLCAAADFIQLLCMITSIMIYKCGCKMSLSPTPSIVNCSIMFYPQAIGETESRIIELIGKQICHIYLYIRIIHVYMHVYTCIYSVDQID